MTAAPRAASNRPTSASPVRLRELDEDDIFNRDGDVQNRRRPHLRVRKRAKPRDRWPAS